jgi:hypothetical protein
MKSMFQTSEPTNVQMTWQEKSKVAEGTRVAKQLALRYGSHLYSLCGTQVSPRFFLGERWKQESQCQSQGQSEDALWLVWKRGRSHEPRKVGSPSKQGKENRCLPAGSGSMQAFRQLECSNARPVLESLTARMLRQWIWIGLSYSSLLTWKWAVI